MSGGAATGKSLLSLSSFTNLTLRRRRPLPPFNSTRTLCLAAVPTTTTSTATSSPSLETPSQTLRQSLLLDRLRLRHLKDQSKPLPKPSKPSKPTKTSSSPSPVRRSGKAGSFEELGVGEEVMGAVREMGISEPTEIQSIGVPAVLAGESVVLGSHTGSGKTLAYLLPIVQLMRQDEELTGMITKPKRPRAVVLCPTRELCEQVFRVTKSISHHARFRSTMISGGGRLRPQEDSLSEPIDMVVGTPGRVLKHIEDGNLVYGEIKYLVLDEADTMFDHGFGPDLRKFLSPLKNRAAKSGDQGFQTVLVTATMTKSVQKLIDEEFQGIVHLRTSSFQKKVASARHDFIKLSGSENKLEALLQVLEPSLSKGNRVMVFCNTLNSSRAVDHFLRENQIFTVNYHGEVPAEERVENLKKFKSEEGDCPTLVCTDLAARGLDLEVDHVIMFDFPKNSIDYLHRTGRTARMGAKGKVTSIVAKKDVPLAAKIEEAIKKNESLESLSVNTVRRETATQRGKANVILTKKVNKPGGKTTSAHKTLATKTVRKGPATKSVKKGAGTKVKRSVTLAKPIRPPVKGAKKVSTKANTLKQITKYDATRAPSSKLSVVGFRGRSSIGRKQQAKMN